MKVQIYHASAGHGHKKAALVLAEALKHKSPSISVETFDSLDFTPAYFKKSYLAIYYYSVKHIPKAWGESYYQTDKPSWLAWGRHLRAAANAFHGASLIKHVIRNSPDVIVNTHFFAAQLLADQKKRGLIQSFLVTVITDSHPHAFWINEGTDLYWVMNQDTADTLIQKGVATEKIIAGGIPVDECFKPAGQQKALRHKFGFSADLFTILLTSGSFGAGDYESVLRLLERFEGQIQCFVVCGSNQALKDRLDAVQFRYPIKVFGFVNFMHELMESSDVMIAKCGGLTTSESLVKNIPMIVTQPIPGQETYNSNFLKRHGASFFAEDLALIPIIIKNILENRDLLQSRRNAILKIAKPNASSDLTDLILKKGS